MSALPWLARPADPLDPRGAPRVPDGAKQCSPFAFNLPRPPDPPPDRVCTRVYLWPPDVRELDRLGGSGVIESVDVTRRTQAPRGGTMSVCWGAVRNRACSKCLATD